MFDDDDDEEDGLSFDQIRDLPIHKKGSEIAEVTRKLIDLIPEDADEQIHHVAGWMIEDAHHLCVKVAGAEGANIYDIRMENAAIIRKSARELIVNTHGLAMHGFKETQYFQLLRDLVEEYRLLFVEWVKGFDQENYIIDRWGSSILPV